MKLSWETVLGVFGACLSVAISWRNVAISASSVALTGVTTAVSMLWGGAMTLSATGVSSSLVLTQFGLRCRATTGATGSSEAIVGAVSLSVVWAKLIGAVTSLLGSAIGVTSVVVMTGGVATGVG